MGQYFTSKTASLNHNLKKKGNQFEISNTFCQILWLQKRTNFCSKGIKRYVLWIHVKIKRHVDPKELQYEPQFACLSLLWWGWSRRTPALRFWCTMEDRLLPHRFLWGLIYDFDNLKLILCKKVRGIFFLKLHELAIRNFSTFSKI